MGEADRRRRRHQGRHPQGPQGRQGHRLGQEGRQEVNALFFLPTPDPSSLHKSTLPIPSESTLGPLYCVLSPDATPARSKPCTPALTSAGCWLDDNFVYKTQKTLKNSQKICLPRAKKKKKKTPKKNVFPGQKKKKKKS